jgi:hypothetical protein
MTTHSAYATTSGLNDWARKLLSRSLDALLAAANPGGSPHTVPVGFAFDASTCGGATAPSGGDEAHTRRETDE